MGLTLHYEGKLKGAWAFDQLIARTKDFADKHTWPTEPIDLAHSRLERVIASNDPDAEDEDVVYEGPVRGLRLEPHPECEPFTLEFDSELFCQDWTKTQFAGPAIHRELVRLLTELEELFVNLTVIDEADYWDDRDEQALKANFQRADEAIQDALRGYTHAAYKVRTADGRFIDIWNFDD